MSLIKYSLRVPFSLSLQQLKNLALNASATL